MNQLAELALGCMMHDAGRFLVGGADDADAEREHPRRCAARLRELAANCPGAIAIAEQHHEQLDGTGFPAGLRAEQIHPWARICALADAYDELVMGAAGQSPLAPAQALERMRQDIGTRFDPDLFELFTEQVKLRPGPSRLGADRPLRGAMPMPLAPGGRKADRRQFPRFPFRKPVVVRSADGQPTGRGDPARAIDLSRGGIHLVSERPYVAGQSIRVWIPSETGGSKQLVAKVMHCRPLAPGEGYAIGARFIRV